MSHRIEMPWDMVFSTEGREWHGLAEVRPVLNREVIGQILHPITEGTITVELDGEKVTLEDSKALVADYRFRDDIPEGQRIKPLSVMGKDYRVITNGEILASVEEAIDKHGLDARICTAGTVRGGKTFFLSLQQDKTSKVEFAQGDDWEFYLNLTTSHDGTDALNLYVCGFRTVCWNTVRAGLDGADKKVKVYHTKGAGIALDALPEIMVAMRNQQDEMVSALSYLAGIGCDYAKAQRIAGGYIAGVTMTPEKDGKIKLSTRASNAVEGVTGLFKAGMGNRGQSLYDLLNGATEYWTVGDGAGKTGTRADKAFRAEFGGAADHKEAFLGMLRDPEARERAEEIGAKVVLNN